MIQDIPDDDWVLRRDLDAAFTAVEASGLVFDALVHPRHLKNLLARLERHPDLRVVIDHSAKPFIRDGVIEPWASDMTRLARETAALCKLSGLVTEAAGDWQVADLRPYVEHVLSAFGAERLVWGSDWPVCTMAASYETWHAAAGELASGLSDAEKDALFGGNAVRLYRLEPDD